MKPAQIWPRIQGRYQRIACRIFFKRPLKMRSTAPYISFTFDDFPRSALHAGGAILGQFGCRGTYYASFGLMGTEAPAGPIFDLHEIRQLLDKGHELGCHTFEHSNSWETNPQAFEDSILKNRKALHRLVPGAVFRSFSYPMVGPRPDTKRRTGKYYNCCRGGGQKFNIGLADLNFLASFFLEHSRENLSAVKEAIDRTCQAKGWLIFTTHDISQTPSRYGCSPNFFHDVVKYSYNSGAVILPVAEALDAICRDSAPGR